MSKDKDQIKELEKNNKDLRDTLIAIVDFERTKHGLAMYRNTGPGALAFAAVGDSDE